MFDLPNPEGANVAEPVDVIRRCEDGPAFAVWLFTGGSSARKEEGKLDMGCIDTGLSIL